MLDRRKFLRGALFVAAAPVIVRASSIMKVRALVDPNKIVGVYIGPSIPEPYVIWAGDVVTEGNRHRYLTQYVITDPNTVWYAQSVPRRIWEAKPAIIMSSRIHHEDLMGELLT